MEIEKPYPRSWLRKYLDFVISDLPQDNNGLRKRDIKPGVNGAFDHVDNKKVIWDESPDKKSLYKWGWIFLGLDFFFIIINYPREGESSLLAFVFGIIFFLPVAWCFIYWKYAPDKKVVIFNRLEGTIELPGMLWDKPHLIKFEDLHAVVATTKYNTFLGAMRTRSWWDRSGSGVYLNIGGWTPWESMSYWVWYMDRNRPLPPGTALDPYRQKDYERRKTESFPPPLYPSHFPIPEWVPGCDSSTVDNLN